MQETEDSCPFCQQSISSELRKQIESFFDESYENQKIELNDFIESYETYLGKLISELELLSNREIAIIDFQALNDKIDLLIIFICLLYIFGYIKLFSLFY